MLAFRPGMLALTRTAGFAAAASLAGWVAAAAGQSAPGPLSLTHTARSLQPGEVVLLHLRSDTPLREATGRALGHEFRFFRAGDEDGREWRALLGIDLDTDPGNAPVVIHATTDEGASLRQEYRLEIADKDFPVRRLTVDPKFVEPPAGEIARIQREARRVASIFETTTGERFWSGPFVAPVPGPSTSSFGRRSILNGQPRSPHSGTDFRAASGTPIRSPNAGRVVLAEDLYFSGNTVIIDHGMGLYSYFAHLSQIGVAEGEMVETGDVVGRVGATGRVTGPHLHWSARLHDARVDPLSLMEVLRRAAGAAAGQ